jgi:hypothetical protein
MIVINLSNHGKNPDCVLIPPIRSNCQEITLDKKTRDGMKVSEQDSCGPPAQHREKLFVGFEKNIAKPIGFLVS